MVITCIDTGNGRECVSDDDGESLRLRLRAFEDEEGSMVAIDECDAKSSTWMNICDRSRDPDSITRICNLFRGKIATVYYNNNYSCPYS